MWGKILLFIVVAISTYLFFDALILRIKLVFRGKPGRKISNPIKRLLYMLGETLSEAHVIRVRFVTGLQHTFIFWAFVIFAFSTLHMLLSGFFNLSIWGENAFTVVMKFLTDIIALLTIVGVVYLAIRRFIVKPEALHLPPSEKNVLLKEQVKKHPQLKSFIVLFLIFILMVTYYIEESAHISLTGHTTGYQPISYLISGLFNGTSTTEVWFWSAWWIHIVSIFVFLAVIPRSKHLHLLTGIINLFLTRDKPSGVLEPIDFEKEEESFGTTKIEEIEKKRLFDLFACIECGRCQDNCPAYIQGTPLSPKWLIVNMREHLLEEGENILKEGESKKPLVGEVISEDALWACTTCGACMEVCPMNIEHILDIVDIRRAQVMMESKFPKELTQFFKGFETQGNPWGIFQGERLKWAEGLDVPKIQENGEAEYLLFIGCAASFDDRAKKIARAMVEILNRAGVSYGILGEEERCSGDPLRRAGNEYMFQMIAEENVELFKNYGIKKIITLCPHCYNTFKNEYPQFGGNYEVYHHSTFILKLLKEGKIKLKKNGNTATYHDPCYLGRHNKIYDEPREVVKNLFDLKEMERARARSLCCGAGGARMWMEDRGKERLNRIRAREAFETGAQYLITACPFCMRMLVDGLNDLDLGEKMTVKDIAEVVLENMEG